MRLTPQTEEQILNLMPDGEYDFMVVKAEDQISKRGSEMIKLTLKILDHNGHERQLYDYLLESMAFKLKHFCDATGLEDKYSSGELDSRDCLNRTGKLTIRKDDGEGTYQAKNFVKDYCKRDPNEKVAEPSKDADLFNDSIPF